jgi:hypothetical protein
VHGLTGIDAAAPLAHQMQHVAEQLDGQDGLDTTLLVMVSTAVQFIPGVEHAGLTIFSQGRVDAPLGLGYATSDLARGIESAQYEAEDGPSLEAVCRRTTIGVVDSCAEERWPAFTAQARAWGVRSMLCLPLDAGDRDGGRYSLNLYSGRVAAFEGYAEDVAQLFSVHAHLAVRHVTQTDQLHAAIATRDVIGQAKGILMQRYKITADQAFRVLKHVSAETHTKLRDVAEQLASSGALPEVKMRSRP